MSRGGRGRAQEALLWELGSWLLSRADKGLWVLHTLESRQWEPVQQAVSPLPSLLCVDVDVPKVPHGGWPGVLDRNKGSVPSDSSPITLGGLGSVLDTTPHER